MKNVTYINAGAGSGKTYTLTEKLTELIIKGAKPEEVILTTFTVDAAAEFKEKAKARLFKEGLYAAAERLDQAMMGTIHSVCQRFIGKYWFNLGLAPNMGVMAEEDTKFYISQSLAGLPTDEELQELRAYADMLGIRKQDGFTLLGIDYDAWQQELCNIITYATNYEIDDFTRSEEESVTFIRQFAGHEGKSLFDYTYLKSVIDEHEEFLNLQKRSATNDKRLEALRKARRSLNHPTIATLKDIDGTIGTPKGFGPLAEEFHEQMADIWHSPSIIEMQERHIRLIFKLARQWKENFAEYKRRKNVIDYNDMEKYMRLLMQDKNIAGEIAKAYRYLFVDEFQDSSPIQVKIFDALSDLMEHTYWVGDYKQAIYGFRGSDIQLTKAVVDRVSKAEGCDTYPLKNSWRSLPEVVKLCNDVFVNTFSEVLSSDNVRLDPVRQDKEGEQCLRYIEVGEDLTVADHVMKLLRDGAKPSEIAVLGRTNVELVRVANDLKQVYGVASNREDMPVTDSPAYALMNSLLRIVGSERDTQAKAQVALLVGEDYSTKRIIEEKLLHDDEGGKAENFLNNVPLINHVMDIRQRLLQQSVAAMVETLAVELNIFNVAKMVEPDASFAISVVETMIGVARLYEDHCVQQNLPATIDGYLAYFEESNPSGTGDPDGVKLLTYHKSKGLEWKYVILISLNNRYNDEKKIIRQEIFGVHAIHESEPSAECPYPEVFIHLIPWIYGSAYNSSCPSEIQTAIAESDLYRQALDNCIAEANRLMYVGMTRARDVLITAIEPAKRGQKQFQWLKDIGIETAGEGSLTTCGWDIFDNGHLFSNYTLAESEFDTLQGQDLGDNPDAYALPHDAEPQKEEAPRNVSPSRIHEKGSVLEHHDFEKRILLNGNYDVVDVGDCIHQIYAAIEEERPAYKIEIQETIDSYGLKSVILEPQEILDAWQRLVDYLTDNYGPAIRTWHERPFRLERDGQMIVGSIDLVWQTKEGDILVDFKTCPLGPHHVLDPESEHYAGWYAGQLDAYHDALEAAGESVLKRFIYYPVNGIIAEVDKAFFGSRMTLFKNIFAFDFTQVDMDKVVKKAIECFDGEISFIEDEPDDEELANDVYLVKDSSTQGVNLLLLKSGVATVEISAFAAKEDVAFAFALLRTLHNEYPEVSIYDGSEACVADLSEENEREVYYYRLDNMAKMIEEQGNIVGINGFCHEFHIFPEYIKACLPDVDPMEWTYQTYEDFAKAQWDYAEYSMLSKAKVTSPDGEEYIARLLTNKEGFAAFSNKVAVYYNEQVKQLNTPEFLEYAKHCKYLHRVDYLQFAIDEMPENEWIKFCEAMPGEVIGEDTPVKEKKHNTYLLRWNPGISSFTLDAYHDALERFHGDFAMDWSIYEWENAHKGDTFYMLAVGDGPTGVMFRGVFTSEPYEGGDWAGNGKKRHYIDIACEDASEPDEPHITLAQLEEAMPDFEWRRGHSGALLTDEQVEILDSLWGDEIFIDDEDSDDEDLRHKDWDNDDEVFDPEQGHGSHLQCIDDDLDSFLPEVFKHINRTELVQEFNAETINEDGSEAKEQFVMLESKSEELAMRYIAQAQEDGNFIRTCFPHCVSDNNVKLKLTAIHEFSNKIEAVLVGELPDEGQEFAFFDLNYAMRKDSYVIGKEYNFALSALAYVAERVPEEELTFTIEADKVANMYAEHPEEMPTDEDGNPAPMNMSSENLVYCLQRSNKYPDDADFWSPICSRVKKVTLMGREFYRMSISIFHDEEGNSVDIPLIAKTKFFEVKPSKGVPVRGKLWLQGTLAE